jgi:cellobiose-specific phosphotransferase system component IIC
MAMMAPSPGNDEGCLMPLLILGAIFLVIAAIFRAFDFLVHLFF